MSTYGTASAPRSMLDAATRPSASRKLIESALDSLGVTINGSRPWDIQVHREEFFDRALRGAGLGLGESYMDGWWDCEALDELVSRALRSNVERLVFGDWRLAALAASAWFRNLQSVSRSPQVAQTHYDLGNDVFESMLGPTMMYSCAYSPNANTLDQAQEAKLDLICRKLALQASDRVLDIGCGWGAFARYAARRFGCKIVGVTISRPQAEYAANLCADLPVTILEEDYRSARLRRYGPPPRSSRSECSSMWVGATTVVFFRLSVKRSIRKVCFFCTPWGRTEADGEPCGSANTSFPMVSFPFPVICPKARRDSSAWRIGMILAPITTVR